MRWNHWTITDCCNALLITCCTALHSMQRWRLGADALPSINPLLHALKTELFFPPRVCSSATHLFVHFQKYLRTPKQYSFIQQRTLAWANSSRRARRHVWCWVDFHPHHCLRGVLGQPPLLKIGTWQVETNHLTLNEICMIWVKTMVELGGPPNCWNTYLTINNALMRRK